MRTLRFLLEKEFRQISRNRLMLPMIFVLPLVQLLILPLAADYEVKNINIAIVDQDHSSLSHQLSQKIEASNYFEVLPGNLDYNVAFEKIQSDKADLILVIPTDFNKNIIKLGGEKVFIAVNAINGTKAAVGANYLNAIIQDFSQSIGNSKGKAGLGLDINILETSSQFWFNPYLNYKVFMVPAILVLLVSMLGAYMCSLNIVIEKEVGTIEQINVSPIKKHHYILGKLIPFWLIGTFVFSLGFFVISWLVYGITPQGSLLLIYSYLALYLVAILGFGLLISTYAETQQQAMSIAFFFMMIFVLMSGLFTSIEVMPAWAKVIAYSSPVTYFIDFMRMVVLKGSEFQHVTKHFLIMGGFALLFNTWAILNYSKRN